MAPTSLTALLVQDDLRLELAPLVQGHLHLRSEALAGLAAVQEVAQAALLHQLTAGKAGQLAEAVRAVNDGVERLNLCVSQDKVAVWSGEQGKLVHAGQAEICLRSDTVFRFYIKYPLHSSQLDHPSSTGIFK